MEEKKKEVKQAEEKIPKTEEIKENKKEEAKEKKNDKKQESNEQEKSNNEVKVEQQEETKTAQQAKSVNTETESTTKKRKTRKKLVLAVLAIALLIIYIVERGEFLEIKEIGEHIISRTYGKKVRFEDVEDTLKNPVKYAKIRTDNSQQIKGENCTVVINVKTGKLITVYPKKTKKG